MRYRIPLIQWVLNGLREDLTRFKSAHFSYSGSEIWYLLGDQDLNSSFGAFES